MSESRTSLTGDAGTENAKDTLCRNVTIYGRCRYEDKGNHFEAVMFRGQILTKGFQFRLRFQP